MLRPPDPRGRQGSTVGLGGSSRHRRTAPSEFLEYEPGVHRHGREAGSTALDALGESVSIRGDARVAGFREPYWVIYRTSP